jgi:MFS family permease
VSAFAFSSLQQWQKNQVAVAASASGVWLGNTLVLPFLPLFVRQLGVEGTSATALWSGVLFAVSPALAALTGPLWGRVADRYGLRLIATRAAAGNALCWFLMAFATNVWHVLMIRTALGILGGFNSISVAAITQLAPQDRTARVIGNLQSIQILSAAIGPFLGGILYQSIGIGNTFYATASITLGSALSILFLYRDGPNSSGSRRAGEGGSVRAYLRRSQYIVPMLVLFSIQMTDRTYTPVVPLFLEQLGTPGTRVATLAGAVFSVAALGEAFSAWLSGRLASRIEVKRLLLVRLALGTALLGPLALSPSPAVFFLWRVTLAFVAGGILTLAYAAAGPVIPDHERGAGYSLLSSTLMLGGSLGPLVAGVLAGLGLRAVFVFNIVVYALLFLAVTRFRTQEERERQGAQPG